MPPSANAELRPRQLLLLPVPRALEVQIEDLFLPSIGASRPPMGYHVSIAGPFFLRPEARDDLLPCIQAVCATTPPLQLEVQGVDVFENSLDDCAVFVDVGPVPQLRRLHRRVVRALDDAVTMQYQRHGPFRPHITLGLNLPSASCAGLRKRANVPLQVRFPASELRLMEQRPQSPWQPLWSFALGSADAPSPMKAERHDG